MISRQGDLADPDGLFDGEVGSCVEGNDVIRSLRGQPDRLYHAESPFIVDKYVLMSLPFIIALIPSLQMILLRQQK